MEKKAIDLFNSGVKISEIAKHLNVSYSKVSTIITTWLNQPKNRLKDISERNALIEYSKEHKHHISTVGGVSFIDSKTLFDKEIKEFLRF